MKQRVSLPPSKIKTQRRKRLIVRIVLIVGILLLIVCALISLFWIPATRITNIEVVGTQSLSTASIIAYVNSELAGTYFFIVPKNNTVIYPKTELEQSLPKKFTTIQKVSISLVNFHSIKIAITERTPDALWCGETNTKNSPCYLLDASGAIYALAATYSGDAYVRYYGAISSTTRTYLTPSSFQSLHALAEALRGKNIPESVYIDENMDAHITFVGGFELLFSLSQDPAEVISRFTLAQTADPFTGHQLSDFQYLDLRFGDKLYYKLKGQ